MSHPKISIIVPSYNQANFIGETLTSIVSQKYPNLELLVFDGGSTDNSVNVIKSFEPHINFWRSEKDGGQSEAINKGFEKATGDIVAWLNSDDLYTAGSLNFVGDFFSKNPSIDCLHGPSEIFGGAKKPFVQGMRPGLDFAQRLAGMPSPQPSFFFRRQIREKVGLLDESLHFGMDYDFFMRLALVGKIEYFDKFPLSRYRIHEASKTTNDKERFAQEWGAIFSTLLQQLEAKKEISHWKSLALFAPRDVEYNVEKVGQHDLKLASGFALTNIATFLNQSGKVSEAVKILAVVRKHYTEIHRIKQLESAFWRLNIKQHFPFLK